MRRAASSCATRPAGRSPSASDRKRQTTTAGGRGDPDAFRGKGTLLPCDDREWSELTPRFSANSDRFGLGKPALTPYAWAER